MEKRSAVEQITAYSAYPGETIHNAARDVVALRHDAEKGYDHDIYLVFNERVYRVSHGDTVKDVLADWDAHQKIMSEFVRVHR
jgi:hypothetical protein